MQFICAQKLSDSSPLESDMIFELREEDECIIKYWVKCYRFRQGYPLFSRAEIEYANMFFDTNDLRYVNKGYAKKGLSILCDSIFKSDLVPYIYLSISNDNIISQRVAFSTGFKKNCDTYDIYHPDALRLYSNAILPSKTIISKEFYESEFQKFEEMFLSFYGDCKKR